MQECYEIRARNKATGEICIRYTAEPFLRDFERSYEIIEIVRTYYATL